MTMHKNFYEAIISWNEAIEKIGSGKVIIGDNDYASNLYKKASAYEKLGFLYLARKGYKEVLKKEPQHTLAKKHFKTYEKIQESYKLETMQSCVQQFITLEGLQNKETKICILKEIEQVEYGTLLKKLADKKTVEEVKDLVIILNDLGYLSTNLGNLSGTKEGELNVKLKFYTDAAVFYHYVITILKEKLNNITPGEIKAFLTQHQINPKEQLNHLQELISTALGGASETIPFVRQRKDYKQSLKTLRNDIEQKLQRAENTHKQEIYNQEKKQKHQGSYVEEVSNLFKTIADNMQEFLGKLYSDSEQELGGPPCKYAVIGLGSMALRQMTPYSDLEFAILTENENYKRSKDPKIKEYFKNLSHLVHFKVINLGESVIPTSRFGVDISHLVHRGVNFDLGGKTPLGRNDKKYKLVQTIGGMLAYVRNENNWAEHIDKNLPYILEKVCYVHGDEQLVTSYKEEVKKFLTSKNESDAHQRLHCEIRAIKLLEEGTVELNYLQQTTSLNINETPFKGDLQKLAPKLDVDNEGRLFDVKQEIYRLPDRLVYNLGLYYSIEGDSNWDIVDKLKDQNVVTPEAAFHLKNAVTFATTLRLKTYFYHKAQREDMSIFSKSVEIESEIEEQAKKIFHLTEDDLREQGCLFQYYYTALPFHERLETFCDKYKRLANADSQTFFIGSDFYVDDHANKGLIYYRLAQYKNAQSNLEQALNETKNIENLKLKNFLGICYDRVNDYDKAIERFGNCLNKFKLINLKKPHPDVANFLNNIGLAFCAKGQFDLAMKYFKKTLKLEEDIYKENCHPYVARSLNNLGSVYYYKGQYDQATKYFEESLKMRTQIFKKKPHPDVAGSFNNLGLAYNAKGQHDQAIKYHEDNLKMVKLIYKEEPHPVVANSLNNLGNAYSAKGQFDQAIKNYLDSQKMKKQIYNEEPHLSVAASLNNIGLAYDAKGQYDQANKYFDESIKMMKLIYKEEPHPDVAGCYNNLGNAYKAKGQYDQAIKYYEDSLSMMKLIYKEEPHSGIATSLNNLGLVYRAKGQYDQAIKYFEDSLSMTKLIYMEKHHPDIADSLNNLGNAYKAKGQYDQAIKFHEESLKMKKLIYKEEPHLDVARSLSNLGSAYSAQGQYDQAMQFHEESLKIKKLVYNGVSHLDMVRSLNHLACASSAKGHYDEAIKYHEDSLNMKKLIYNEKPHLDIASSLNNLGLAYYDKGLYDQAIKYHDGCLQMKKLIYKEEPHPDVAGCYSNLGLDYSAKGQYDQAIKYFEDSLSMMKLIYKEKPHPDVASSLNFLGNAYSAVGQFDQAVKYHDDCLQMKKLIYKEDPHPDVAGCYSNLGLDYSAKGQYDQAIKYFEDSLSMMKLIYKEEPHPGVANSLNFLGNAFSAVGQFDQAIKYHNDCLQMKKLIYKEDPHPDVAGSLNYLGNAYRDKGQYDLAINYGCQALLMISNFKDYPYIRLIKNDVKKTTLLFVKNFSLDPQVIINKLIEITGESNNNIILWLAIEEWDSSKIQELITDGVDLDNVPFMASTTPLIQAIVMGDVEMVRLISEKANINKLDNDQNKASPLYYSLGYGGQPINLEIVKLLLEKGADVSQALYDGDTPMHMAHYKGSKEAIKLLLSYKADIKVKNVEGKTPLLCLLEQNDLSLETKLEIISEHYHICDDKTMKDQEGNVVIDSTLYHSLNLELVFNSNEVVEPNHLPTN